MATPDKVDLKEVNKKKKTLKFPKITNPFTKRKGPKRDQVGKFAPTVGSGGLSRAKTLNAKRALPVVVMVSLVGGLFVFQSFAANANGAFVTEMYQRCYNQMISSGGGYDFWLKKLDAGTSRNSVWASFVAASGKPCNNPYPPASANSTPAPSGTSNGTASMTAQQIVALYQEILGRTPGQSDVDYWVNKSKTTAPAQIRALIENTDEAFRKNISKKVVEAQAWKTLSDAHVVNAKKNNDVTYKISIQDQITKANLETIASKERSIREAISQVKSGESLVSQNYQRAVRLNLSNASELSSLVKSLSSSVGSLNAYLKNVSADYTRAEKRYTELLNFYDVASRIEAQKNRCMANGGAWQWWRNYCQMPVPSPAQNTGNTRPNIPGCPSSINSNSSPECIRLLQTMLKAAGFYTGALDGLWGNLTSQALYRWQASMQGGGACQNCQTSPPPSGGTGSQPAPSQPEDCRPNYFRSGNICWHKNDTYTPTCPSSHPVIGDGYNKYSVCFKNAMRDSATSVTSRCDRNGFNRRQNSNGGDWRCRRYYRL